MATPANQVYTPSLRPDGGVVWRGWQLTRTGVGLYTAQWVGPNGAGSVPWIGISRGDVVSSTNRYDPIWIKAESASAGTVTMAITLGGTLTDPGSSELIRLWVEVCDAGNP